MPAVRGQRSGGQNAKTVKEHKIQGTYQPSRHAGVTNPDPPQGVPEMLAGLTDEGRAEWDRMLVDLKKNGTLYTVHGAVLRRYCRMHQRAERINTQLNALDSLWFWKVTIDGSGQEHREPKQMPLVAEARQLDMAIKGYLVEFGLTPASMGRIRVPEAPPDDDFAEFDGLKATT